MFARRRLRGMTLTGIVLSVTIASSLMAMVFGALTNVTEKGYDTVCRNNLRQIATALEMYHQSFGVYPPDYPQGTWADCLLPALGGKEVFHCPADEVAGRNSYEPFYVLRREDDQSKFVIGCPRHGKHTIANVLFADKTSERLSVERVMWTPPGSTEPQELAPGEGVKGGKLSFADTSELTAVGPTGMMVVQSFRLSDGRLYSVVRVLDGEGGQVHAKVNKGSRFDVVTPGVVAGAEGTQYSVGNGLMGTENVSFVSCSAGRIYVASTDGKYQRLSAGSAVLAKTGLEEAPYHRHWHCHRVDPSDPNSTEFIWHRHGHAVKDHHGPYADYGTHAMTAYWQYLGGFPGP